MIFIFFFFAPGLNIDSNAFSSTANGTYKETQTSTEEGGTLNLEDTKNYANSENVESGEDIESQPSDVSIAAKYIIKDRLFVEFGFKRVDPTEIVLGGIWTSGFRVRIRGPYIVPTINIYLRSKNSGGLFPTSGLGKKIWELTRDKTNRYPLIDENQNDDSFTSYNFGLITESIGPHKRETIVAICEYVYYYTPSYRETVYTTVEFEIEEGGGPTQPPLPPDSNMLSVEFSLKSATYQEIVLGGTWTPGFRVRVKDGYELTSIKISLKSTTPYGHFSDIGDGDIIWERNEKLTDENKEDDLYTVYNYGQIKEPTGFIENDIVVTCRYNYLDNNGIHHEYAIVIENIDLKKSGIVSLLCVHGYHDNNKDYRQVWDTLQDDINFKNYYQYNIIAINYYGDAVDYPPEFVGVTVETPIQEIAFRLKNYIIAAHAHELLRNHLDIVCHSMGGLVIRAMIKYYYHELKAAGITIDHVAMLGTPNYGANLISLLGEDTTQLREVSIGSDFLNALNDASYGGDTPYSLSDNTPFNDIQYTTFAGAVENEAGVYYNDGLVRPGKVWLNYNDAINHPIYYDVGHTELCSHADVLSQLLKDFMNDVRIELVPSSEPQSDAVLPSLELIPLEEGINYLTMSSVLSLKGGGTIDPSSVYLSINSQFPMSLVQGTLNTYEVNFTLPDGTYNYSIHASDTAGNTFVLPDGDLSIIDDDITPPTITLAPESTIITDEEAVGGVLLEWDISDFSGIREASVSLNGEIIRNYGTADAIIDSYFLPNILGTYMLKVWARENDEDPGHIASERDWFEITVEKEITIRDDDLTPPEVVIDYYGSNTDGDSGYWSVFIEDLESGVAQVIVKIDGVQVGISSGDYSAPNNLGEHIVEVIATNGDTDRPGDPETNAVSDEIVISDDDISPPAINYTYAGEGTDANPGTIVVSAYDASGLSVDPSGTYAIPNSLGTHLFNFTATDADEDRPGDTLTTTISIPITIIDDDISPPTVSEVLISEDDGYLIVSFNVTDDSGIATIEILIDGKGIVPDVQTQINDTYAYKYNKELFFELGIGIYYVVTSLTDGDNDRASDSLTTVIVEFFEIGTVQLLNFVKYELTSLKAQVNESVEKPFKCVLLHQLDIAVEKINDALAYYISGMITHSVFLEKISKINLQIMEIIAQIGDKTDNIDENFAEYLVRTFHQVRDQITYAMSATIGFDTALAIASVEIKINRLADNIYENMTFFKAIFVDINLWQTCDKLDWALIFLSKGCDKSAECMKNGAIKDLERATCKISLLEYFGWISHEQACALKSEINKLVVSLQEIVI